MAMRWIGDGVTGVLTRAMEGASLRQRVLANNIANANTPGFKRSDVTFAGCLVEAVERRQPGTPSGGVMMTGGSREWGPRVVTQSHTTSRNDGNNVEIEQEMALLSSTALWYQSLTRVTSDRLGRYRSVIQEGRR